MWGLVADGCGGPGLAAAEILPLTPLLSVEHLSVGFRTEAGFARVVDDLSLAIGAGRIVGLVGESGCGKCVTALSIMRLLPMPPGGSRRGTSGSRAGTCRRCRAGRCGAVRGNRIGMIFQEPMTSLNPAFPVGDQIAEAVRLHRAASRAEAARPRARAARAWSGSPRPSGGARSIRTSSRAACASGS